MTVFALPDDAGARILTDELRRMGADCHFADGSEDTPVLARHLLTSQMLLICGKAALPEQEQILFALQTLQAAGGCVLCLGEGTTLPSGISAVQLPEGLPRERLANLFF